MPLRWSPQRSSPNLSSASLWHLASGLQTPASSRLARLRRSLRWGDPGAGAECWDQKCVLSSCLISIVYDVYNVTVKIYVHNEVAVDIFHPDFLCHTIIMVLGQSPVLPRTSGQVSRDFSGLVHWVLEAEGSNRGRAWPRHLLWLPWGQLGEDLLHTASSDDPWQANYNPWFYPNLWQIKCLTRFLYDREAGVWTVDKFVEAHLFI